MPDAKKWEKQPAIEGGMHPCVCCGAIAQKLKPESVIAVGFGSAFLSKDGECIWDEQEAGNESRYMTCAEAEVLALKDPDHDWRITLFGPLAGRVYQRHAAGEWVLIEQNKGFA